MSFLSLIHLHSFITFIVSFLSISSHTAHAFTGSEYALDTDYSGANFFGGWDFFTDRDPTGGFVTYYGRSSAYLSGLVQASDSAPAYIGVDHDNELPITPAGRADGAGRPSVRISSKRSWTHGLFIGDFNHAPTGICGTWPAFWTLGPNWPYTGEVDILEGVNKVVTNAMSLHTNETCFISGNSSTQIGTQSNTNCAYYPDYNVGCGVIDSRPASYSKFNSIGGGVYAMQWTSQYIRIWFFARNAIPQDIIDKKPDPSTWGLPSADLKGDCAIDQHFQQHKIVFDTTFCGEWAGNQYVWNSTINSCAIDTGYPTCDAFVAKEPAAFRDAYWSINYVRVYQLVNPTSMVKASPYIASLQSPDLTNQYTSTSTPAASPTALLCPTYNYTTIQHGGLTYEVECDYDPPGPDIPPPYPNYPIRSFEDCVAGCTYWNTINGTHLCGAVAYDSSIPFCYFKRYVDQMPKYRKGFAGARLIYYGYPQITDDPRSQPALGTSTFIETIPTPEYYRPNSVVVSSSNTLSSYSTTSVSVPTVGPPPMGTVTNATIRPTISAGIPTISYSGPDLVPVTNVTVPATATAVILTTRSNGEVLASTVRLSISTSIGIPSERTGVVTAISSSSIVLSKDVSSESTMTQTFKKPGPTAISSFIYAGCKATASKNHDMVLTRSSSNMTLEYCVTACGNTCYAALSGSECYCGNYQIAETEFFSYPDSACNTPCPGNLDEKCGGALPGSGNDTTYSRKRQSSDVRIEIVFTIYSNAELVGITTTTYSDTTIGTVSTVPAISESSQLSQTSKLSTVAFTASTRTTTLIVISTTWCDYCATCPQYLTTLATAITVPCLTDDSDFSTSTADLMIPMTTTTRHCNCGPNGQASTMTVNIPWTVKINSLISAARESVMAIGNNAGLASEPSLSFATTTPQDSTVALTTKISGSARTSNETLTPMSVPISIQFATNATHSPVLKPSQYFGTATSLSMSITFAGIFVSSTVFLIWL